jgi:lipid-A-disaccharide synthase
MTELEKPTLQIDFVAGEASGDRHAAELLRALRKLYPRARFGGVGGRHLKAAGQEQLFDLAAHAVVGLTDVLLNYRKFKNLFDRLVRDIEARQPDAVILVDFPGFNLRLAERLRQRLPTTKLIYYISPQVWAWKAGRAQKMARILDHLLVIFRFEKEWFAQHAPTLPVSWSGHPVLDRWDQESSQAEADDGSERLALLPGSRRREIEAHLPIILEAARQIVLRRPGLKLVLLAADLERRAQIEKFLARRGWAAGLPLEIRMGYAMTHLSRCRLALVASGTATLECAVANLPMLILYRVNPITFWIGRRLVKLPYIGMVNVISGRKVMPEFLQGNADPARLAEAALLLLEQPKALEKMRQDLADVRATLGSPGANERASRVIRDVIEGRKAANSLSG